MKKNLKLLVTAYDYRPKLGGVASCAYELTRELARLPGVEVKLIARAGSGDEAFDRHSGIHTARVKLANQTPFASLQLSRYLRRECREFKADAILNFLWLPSGVAAYTTHVPYFLIAHGVEVVESTATFRKRLRKRFMPLKRLVFRGAKQVFAVSAFTASKVISSCGVPAERVKVCSNGVNPDSFFRKPANAPEVAAIRAKHGADGRVLFLTLTRLLDYKGVDFTIRAMKWVVQEEPTALCLICGEGSYMPELQEMVKKLGLENHVRFTGALPFEDLNDYYNACDAYVLMSREDWAKPNFEGFGLVFLEAAACGKPSIAGDSGGISDAVIHGQTGWLVSPIDEGAIAAAMIDCIRNESRRKAFGEAAHARALSSYTWARMALRIEEEIRKNVRN